MDDTGFWSVIELLDPTQGDDGAVRRPAAQALAAMTTDEIIEFERILTEKLFGLDTREHARWCYPDNEYEPDDDEGYFSMDDFLYARCSVVATGREFYECVLARPSLFPTDVGFECLLDLASGAHEAKTGETFDAEFSISYETFSNVAGWTDPAMA